MFLENCGVIVLDNLRYLYHALIKLIFDINFPDCTAEFFLLSLNKDHL